jgi:hypothetical protein
MKRGQEPFPVCQTTAPRCQHAPADFGPHRDRCRDVAGCPSEFTRSSPRSRTLGGATSRADRPVKRERTTTKKRAVTPPGQVIGWKPGPS